jgi:putative transposase
MKAPNQIVNLKKIKHYNTINHAHELTFSCYEKRCYLMDPRACEIFLEEFGRAKIVHKFKIWAYVLMPDHVHLLLKPEETQYNIAKILNDIKGRMAFLYRDYFLKSKPEKFNVFCIEDTSKDREVFRFWQPGPGYDRNFWNAEAIKNSIRYIEANPVKDMLVEKPSDYRWSSAYARFNNTGLVPDEVQI